MSKYSKYTVGLYVEIEMEGTMATDALDTIKMIPQLTPGQELVVAPRPGVPPKHGRVLKTKYLTLVRAEEVKPETEMLMRRWDPNDR